MSSDSSSTLGRAAALRRAFDDAFRETPRGDEAIHHDFLSVRLMDDRYAVRMTEIAGLFVDRPVSSLPGPIPELLGIAGVRGSMLPVYSLPALLGYRAASKQRWLLVSSGAAKVALAFDDFEGHLRVSGDALLDSPDAGRAGTHLRGLVQAAGVLRPIIHLPSVLEAVRQRLQTSGRQKEQST